MGMGTEQRVCLACEKTLAGDERICPTCGAPTIKRGQDDLTGRLIDRRYRILERIGRGGMGVVYKAHHEAIDRIVAIKFLRREFNNDESLARRFLVEAKAIARLKSQHTVGLYDFGTTDEGFLFFTMEFCQGCSLTSVLREEKRLPWPRALDLASQVCESLEEAHAQGVFHRDLKPENLVLVPAPDGTQSVKVLDFGIALLASSQAGERLTQTGMIVGTPEYMSPEQTAGRTLDGRTDLYSLGVILYEMVAGRLPFKAASTTELLLMHLSAPPPPMECREGEAPVPEAVEALVRTCLEKEPGKRPASATELRRMLRELIDTKALPALEDVGTARMGGKPADLRKTSGYEEAGDNADSTVSVSVRSAGGAKPAGSVVPPSAPGGAPAAAAAGVATDTDWTQPAGSGTQDTTAATVFKAPRRAFQTRLLMGLGVLVGIAVLTSAALLLLAHFRNGGPPTEKAADESVDRRTEEAMPAGIPRMASPLGADIRTSDGALSSSGSHSAGPDSGQDLRGDVLPEDAGSPEPPGTRSGGPSDLRGAAAPAGDSQDGDAKAAGTDHGADAGAVASGADSVQGASSAPADATVQDSGKSGRSGTQAADDGTKSGKSGTQAAGDKTKSGKSGTQAADDKTKSGDPKVNDGGAASYEDLPSDLKKKPDEYEALPPTSGEGKGTKK